MTNVAHTLVAEFERVEQQIRESPKYRHALYEKACGLQEALAEEFGRRHGWRHSCSSFSLWQLTKQTSRAPDWDDIAEDSEFAVGLPRPFDHNYYYREPKFPYRPVAIATHPYDPRMHEFHILALRYGLIATKVDDFPSWWYPGSTSLVLVVRGRLAGSVK